MLGRRRKSNRFLFFFFFLYRVPLYIARIYLVSSLDISLFFDDVQSA